MLICFCTGVYIFTLREIGGDFRAGWRGNCFIQRCVHSTCWGGWQGPLGSILHRTGLSQLILPHLLCYSFLCPLPLEFSGPLCFSYIPSFFPSIPANWGHAGLAWSQHPDYSFPECSQKRFTANPDFLLCASNNDGLGPVTSWVFSHNRKLQGNP